MKIITRQEVDELYAANRVDMEACRIARGNLSVAQRRFAAARKAEKISGEKWVDAAEKLEEQGRSSAGKPQGPGGKI
jgi:hypothetical protein